MAAINQQELKGVRLKELVRFFEPEQSAERNVVADVVNHGVLERQEPVVQPPTSTVNTGLIEQDGYLQTALHRAAKYERLESLQSLLDSFTDADQLFEALHIQDSEGRTALHYAVTNSPEHIAALLNPIRYCQKDKLISLLKSESTYGENVFHVANKYIKALGHLLDFIDTLPTKDILDVLLMKDKQGFSLCQIQWCITFVLSTEDTDQQTRLHRLIKSEDIETLRKFLNIGEQIIPFEVLRLQDQGGKTSLHEAMATSPDHAKEILKHISQLPKHNIFQLMSAVSTFGQTPFHIAAKQKSGVLLTSLLGVIANPKDQYKILCIKDKKEWTVMHYAASASLSQISAVWNHCSLTNRHKQMLLSIQDGNGETPLHIAARYGTAGSFVSLLRDMNFSSRRKVLKIDSSYKLVRGCIGGTSLQYAATWSTPQLMLEFLAYFITIKQDESFELLKIGNTNGDTILFYVINPDTLETIINHLTTARWLKLVSLKNNDGRTCLHMAVAWLRLDVVLLLLKSIDNSHRTRLLCEMDSNGGMPLDFLFSFPDLADKLLTATSITLSKILNLIEPPLRLELVKSSIFHLSYRYTDCISLMRLMFDNLSCPSHSTLDMLKQIEAHITDSENEAENTNARNIILFLQEYQADIKVNSALSTNCLQGRYRYIFMFIIHVAVF